MDRASIFHDPDEERCPGLRVHPIAREAAPPPRGLAWLLTLPSCALCVLGLGALRFESRAVLPLEEGRIRSVRVDLEPGEPTRAPRKRNLEDPVKGQGDRNGTDTVDPKLLHLDAPPVTTISGPKNLDPADLVAPGPEAESSGSTFRKDLPPGAGGNGRARGTGRDLGSGGASGDSGRGLEELIPLRTVHARWEHSKAQDLQVKVLILIAEDGRVVKAEAVSGPEEYRAESVAAALQWSFRVPSHLRARCPLARSIIFRPTGLP